MSEETNNMTIENFCCPNCGGTMKWNIAKQKFECAACRTPGEIEALHKKVSEHDFSGYAKRAKEEVAFPDQTTITCSTCGASVILEKTQTAATCPMCGSTQVAKEKQEAGVAPDGLIPFAVDKNQAQANFRKWVKSRWFAPNRLKKAYQEGKLDGMYVPYWTFDADVEADYRGRGGKVRKDEDDKEEIIWTNVSGHVEQFFDDVAVCASEQNVKKVIDEVEPYSTQEKSVPYASAYLSGFQAEHYSIPADQAIKTAKDAMEGRLRSEAERKIRDKGYDRAEVQQINFTYKNVRYKHVLVPAWVSAFAYSGKRYLYVINGETGKVGGQRPYSVPKIIAAILAALIIVIGFVVLTDDADAAVLNQAQNQEVIEQTYEYTELP